MAKYDVRHSCGHTQTHQLYGPGRDRESKINWLETTLCSDCWRAEQEKQRTAENAAAKDANTAAGSVPLIGSEKQIAWAETIRRPVCAALRTVEKRPIEPELSHAAAQELRDAIILVIDEVLGETQAHNWIELRDDGLPTKEDDAVDWVLDRIHERGLAPNAERESAEITERRRQERRAAEEADWKLANAIADNLREEIMIWDGATDTVSATVDGHAVACTGSGYYATVKVDGAEFRKADLIRSKMVTFRGRLVREKADREKADRTASYAGAQVASVQKDKQDLAVTLTDGRVLTGKSSREGWSLTHAGKGYNMPAIDSANPEIERIAEDARKWHKAHGKAGA